MYYLATSFIPECRASSGHCIGTQTVGSRREIRT